MQVRERRASTFRNANSRRTAAANTLARRGSVVAVMPGLLVERCRRAARGDGACGVEAVVADQMVARADGVRERVREADAGAARAADARLGERLGGGAAEAAHDRVLLDGDDGAGTGGGCDQRGGVERLDRAEVQQRWRRCPRRRAGRRRRSPRAAIAPREAMVTSAPPRSSIARPTTKRGARGEQVGLAVLAQPQVDGALDARPRRGWPARASAGIARRRGRSCPAARASARGPRSRGGSGRASRRTTPPPTPTSLTLASAHRDVDAHLVVRPRGDERGDRVGERHLAGVGEAGGDADEVLLGDADVQVAARAPPPRTARRGRSRGRRSAPRRARRAAPSSVSARKKASLMPPPAARRGRRSSRSRSCGAQRPVVRHQLALE